MVVHVCPKAEFKFPFLVNKSFSVYLSYYLFCGLKDNLVRVNGQSAGFLHSCSFYVINVGSKTSSLLMETQLESHLFFSFHYILKEVMAEWWKLPKFLLELDVAGCLQWLAPWPITQKLHCYYSLGSNLQLWCFRNLTLLLELDLRTNSQTKLTIDSYM